MIERNKPDDTFGWGVVLSDETLANLATKAGVEGTRFRVHTPLIDWPKSRIIEEGTRLGVDYARTVSCYQANERLEACGRCDSCRLRAAGFAAAFAERLQLDPSYLFEAFEDTWYYLWRERRLPSNVDVDANKAKDPLERARISRVFEQGLESAVGTVLPIARDHGNGRRWRSGPWFLRSEKCYLIPGDSPIGFRLGGERMFAILGGDQPIDWILRPARVLGCRF